MLDLQQFCGSDVCRFYLMKPFSRDGFTWATNGHIMVRVPQRADVPDIDKKIKMNVSKPLEGIETAKFFKPAFTMPPAPTEVGECCTACDGRGFDHDCPDCECVCAFCHGGGEADKEARITTAIGGKFFSLRYVRQVLSLPGIEIAEAPATPDEKPIFFRFEDGVGALMPMRSASHNHIEIEKEPA